MTGNTRGGSLYAFVLCMCLGLVILGETPTLRIAGACALLATILGGLASLRVPERRLRTALRATVVLAVLGIACMVMLRRGHGGSAVDGSCAADGCYVVSHGERHQVTRPVYMMVAVSELAVVSLIAGFMAMGLFPQRSKDE